MLGRQARQGADDQVTTASVFVVRVRHWIPKDSLLAWETYRTDHSLPVSARVIRTYGDPPLTIL